MGEYDYLCSTEYATIQARIRLAEGLLKVREDELRAARVKQSDALAAVEGCHHELARAGRELDKAQAVLRDADDEVVDAMGKVAAQKKLRDDVLAKLVPEPAEPGNIHAQTMLMSFTKKFKGEQEYYFAAVRPIGQKLWSITGQTTYKMNWDGLLAFIKKDEQNPAEAIASIRFGYRTDLKHKAV